MEIKPQSAWIQCALCLCNVGFTNVESGRILNKDYQLVQGALKRRGVKPPRKLVPVDIESFALNAIVLHQTYDFGIHRIAAKLRVSKCIIRKVLIRAKAYNPEASREAQSFRYAVQSAISETKKAKSKPQRKPALSKEHRRENALAYYYSSNGRERARVSAAKRYNWIKLYQREALIPKRLRSRLYRFIKGQASESMSDLVGCSWEALVFHLESTFKPGMTWANYGDWHVDHKIACSLFDLTNVEDRKRCFHYSNLQALWARDNLSKGNRAEAYLFN